jgi:rhomboid family GlyGly-CTERM serine protease
LQLGQPVTNTWLRYHRSYISDGEIWRLFSAHLVHLSWSHYAMNCAGLLLVYGLYWRWLTAATMLMWCLSSALAVALGLMFFSPQITWFVGFSGVLHGLIVAGAVTDIQAQRWEGLWVIGIVAIKLVWETLYGPLPGSEAGAGGPVVVDAHLYGAIGGLIVPIAQVLLSRNSRASA